MITAGVTFARVTDRQPVVAVVDDDESIREALAGLLSSVGLTVILFASAEEFLRHQRPDEIGCLILDWHMPGMDGQQLQSTLAATGLSIPIVFLTAHYTEERRAQAMKAGAIAFLQKPADTQKLLEAIDRGLGQSFLRTEP